MKNLKPFIISVACGLLLTACAGTNFKWDSARQIREGMTTSEVEAIMGHPKLVQSRPDGSHVYVWSYFNGMTGASKSLAVVFVNGKVTAAPAIPNSF